MISKANKVLKNSKSGFTLVEIMVAVSIFAIVAVITTGALVTASSVNKKAQAIKLAMDNLSFAIDSITLNLSDGVKYHCLTGTIPDSPSPSSYGDVNSCPSLNNPGQGIAFGTGDCGAGAPSGACKMVIYRYKSTDGNGSIQVWRESVGGGFVTLTAPEVNITNFKVYVYGGNEERYRALLSIKGQVNDTTNTAFNLQTTINAKR